MNRAEKLQFIKEEHPELYKLLEENVRDFVEDVWNASVQDIFSYNIWVSFYCKQFSDTELRDELLI